MSWNLRSAALGLFLVTLGIALPARADRKDLEVPLELPAASALGSYSGTVRIAIGDVKDATFSESPSHVGMGPQAIYEIVSVGTRAESLRQGVSEALNRAGLLAASPAAATYTMDVTIRRVHEQPHMTFSRFRLRAELFLEFSFMKDGVRQGWVLACGNAQEYAQVATQAKFTEVYQQAFNDAIYKLLNSRTLARIAGDGWKPVPTPAVSGDHHTTRIDKEEFYGPTDTIQADAASAAAAMQTAGAVTTVSIPDFALADVGGKKTDAIADPAFARSLVPELVREHLNAFFPGAFATIERQSGSTSGQPALLVDGRLDNFRIGNVNARIWIGFGAGKDELKGEVSFKDAATGKTLHTFKVGSSNWGAGWQTKNGTIRDMSDQLARDIAYFLVKTAVPNYRPPEGLEIIFDDTPYPTTQRKS